MICPKCNKNMSTVRTAVRDIDGGMSIDIKCPNCDTEFESFITADNLEEIFELTDE